VQVFLEKMSVHPEILVLGTGGTIAGTAASASDHTGYTAAQLSVESLLGAVPGLQEALAGAALRSEQLAQIDSKDMDFSTMLRVAQRCAQALAEPQIQAVLITHGTDTLEETAYFLHRVIPQALRAKPVVLTCAMRPATSSEADGPRNLRDAVRVARDARAHGVLAVCAGQVHHALAVQKVHTYALNAFSSGDPAQGEPGLLGRIVGDALQWLQPPADFEKNRALALADAQQFAIDLGALSEAHAHAHAPIAWPRVEIVLNHAQASGSMVSALLAADSPQDPLRGIVVAATGNGTVSAGLSHALQQARQKGVAVVIASRCAWGGIHAGSPLSAVKARVELVLRLLAAQG
jgi:L-asparaginase